MKDLTIIMYHYVRPIIGSKYPKIKGLEVKNFIKQLDYLEENFNFVSAEDILAYVTKNKKIPQNACWLTFDDGYKDHYQYVYPLLKERGVQGSFFPPKTAIQDNKILDVNSIHFILANCNDTSILKKEIEELCCKNSISKDQLSKYWNDYSNSDRFDDEITTYIKRMLQHVLPKDLRQNIINILFNRYVGLTQKEFSKEVYASMSELREMVNNGMHIGSHGSQHNWLDQMSKNDQKNDIVESLSFLEDLGMPTKDWIMCYPYGAFNEETLEIVKNLGAAIGVTTKIGKANLLTNNLLALPRFDTNDFPQ